MLSMHVHIDQQNETVVAMRQTLEVSLQHPAFKKVSFPICADGDMIVGDFRNGTGPGGTGYTQCAGFVLTFSFQGADAYRRLPSLVKRLAGTTLAR